MSMKAEKILKMIKIALTDNTINKKQFNTLCRAYLNLKELEGLSPPREIQLEIAPTIPKKTAILRNKPIDKHRINYQLVLNELKIKLRERYID